MAQRVEIPSMRRALRFVGPFGFVLAEEVSAGPEKFLMVQANVP